MKCHQCGTEVQIQQGFCPRCGAFMGMPAPAPAQSRTKTGFLLIVVLGLLIGVTVVPGLVLWKSGLMQQLQRRARLARAPRRLKQEHIAVKLSELHGEGEVYFVPLGKQVVAPTALIQHYKDKFNLSIHLLPALPIDRATFNEKRNQYDSERMVEQIKRAFPNLAKDPKTVLIGLTNEDIYIPSYDWEFTYSYRESFPHVARLGVVSTCRMDDAFWGEPSRPELIELRDRQMITKYIAVLYWRLPLSRDPESVLYQPFTPDGRPDDLWETDIHPEDSVFGLTGDEFCVVLVYSYQTGKATEYIHGEGCDIPDQRDTSIEVFRLKPKYTDLGIYKTDFVIPGKPPIVFQRVHRPLAKLTYAFGVGTSHSCDRFLHTDNVEVMNKAELIYPDGGRWKFARTSPGRGFVPGMTFEGEENQAEYSNALLVRESEDFSLRLQNGESYTFLPCHGKTHCYNYESGYQDAEGKRLTYTRGLDQFLTSVSSQSGSLTLTYDSKPRITDIHNQHGQHVRYDYDDAGYLSKVTLPDGTVTEYERSDGGHRLAVFVTGKHHARAEIFSAEFDGASRVVKATVSDLGTYTLEYEFAGKEVQSVLLTLPGPKKVRVSYDGDSYVAYSER